MAEKRKAFNQNQRAKGRDKSTIDPAPMTDCNCYGDYAKNRIGKNLFIKKKLGSYNRTTTIVLIV